MGKRSVPWREWGRGAFDEARATGCPVLLLMSDEWSAESTHLPASLAADPVVAPLLSTSFIPVLVDADRQPDVALVYGTTASPSACILQADGAVLVSLPRVDKDLLVEALRGARRFGASPHPMVRRGLGLCPVPYLPADEEGLERGSETLEVIRRGLEGLLESETGEFGKGAGPHVIGPLAFLLDYAVEAGDEHLRRKAIQGLHALALSELYDPVEGGFHWRRDGVGVRTAKRLQDNSEWLGLALAAASDPEGRFAIPLARGILHYLQTRLLLPSGAFAAGGAEDAPYFALSAEQRRSVPPPRTIGPVYADANAAAIRALCRAWQVLGERAYLDLALGAFRFVRANLVAPDGTVAHVYDQSPRGIGFLRDQVEWGFALLGLYQSTLDSGYLSDLRQAAGNLLDFYQNPAGAGLLNVRILPREEGLPLTPVAEPALNAKAALFLAQASSQLEEPALAAPVRATLSALVGSELQDPVSKALLGSALMAILYPVSYFVAVTDGSAQHRARIVERIQAFGRPFPLILHREPAAGEHMQALPKLTAHCAQQKKEIPLG